VGEGGKEEGGGEVREEAEENDSWKLGSTKL
jgi:hypothetical protein